MEKHFFDKYLVVGTPISHSLSPRLHNAAYRELGLSRELRAYDPFIEGGEAGFERLVGEFRQGAYQGLCVTIPYKLQAAISCDVLSHTAQRTGAVNYIRRESDGSLSGDNTDVRGFAAAVQLELGLDLRDCCQVAVCGSGGAARAVVDALTQAGVECIALVTRDPKRVADEWGIPNSSMSEIVKPHAASLSPAEAQVQALCYEALERSCSDFDLLVNATSLGMNDDLMPVPADWLGSQVAAVYDVVYRKMGTTPLVATAGAAGILAADGRSMLIEQAIVGMQFWGIEESSARLRSIIYACLS